MGAQGNHVVSGMTSPVGREQVAARTPVRMFMETIAQGELVVVPRPVVLMDSRHAMLIQLVNLHSAGFHLVMDLPNQYVSRVVLHYNNRARAIQAISRLP